MVAISHKLKSSLFHIQQIKGVLTLPFLFSSSFYSAFFFFAFLEHLEIYRFPVLRQLCLQSL